MKSTKDIGDFGEQLAAKHLKKLKFKILDRNLHKGKNELDLVAKNKEFIVFAEVKTRCVDDPKKIYFEISAASAVYSEKRKRTVLAAREYLAENETNLQPRFDVIEVYLSKSEPLKLIEINHIENAFC